MNIQVSEFRLPPRIEIYEKSSSGSKATINLLRPPATRTHVHVEKHWYWACCISAMSDQRSPCTDSVYLLFTIVETIYTADRVTRARWYNVIARSDAETEYGTFFFFYGDVYITQNPASHHHGHHPSHEALSDPVCYLLPGGIYASYRTYLLLTIRLRSVSTRLIYRVFLTSVPSVGFYVFFLITIFYAQNSKRFEISCQTFGKNHFENVYQSLTLRNDRSISETYIPTFYLTLLCRVVATVISFVIFFVSRRPLSSMGREPSLQAVCEQRTSRFDRKRTRRYLLCYHRTCRKTMTKTAGFVIKVFRATTAYGIQRDGRQKSVITHRRLKNTNVCTSREPTDIKTF